MESVTVGLGVVPSAGSDSSKGQILDDATDLESGQVRHHGDVATSRESVEEYGSWSACSCKGCDSRQNRGSEAGSLCTKPVHVQLVKVQAALGRAEEVAEKKQAAVWAAREAADKAHEHVASLRQRMAELTETIHSDADAHMAEDQWGFGEWQEGGGSWSGWQWDQQGDCVQTQRNMSMPGGETAALGMEVENPRGAGCVDDACDGESVQAEPRAAGESVGACNTKSALQEGGRPNSGSPWRKVPSDRGQRGRVDCWRSGGCTAAAAAAAAASSVCGTFFVLCESCGCEGS